MLGSACNATGYFIATNLLYPTYTVFTAAAFLLLFLLDLCIRTFASGSQPHSCHRHFIDPRPIDCTTHLWAAFHNSPLGLCLDSSQPTSTCCVSLEDCTPALPTLYQVSVSGRYPFIPLFGISVRENSVSSAIFTSSQGIAPFIVCIATYRFTITENKLR